MGILLTVSVMLVIPSPSTGVTSALRQIRWTNNQAVHSEHEQAEPPRRRPASAWSIGEVRIGCRLRLQRRYGLGLGGCDIRHGFFMLDQLVASTRLVPRCPPLTGGGWTRSVSAPSGSPLGGALSAEARRRAPPLRPGWR
jgi:hypothetical protein